MQIVIRNDFDTKVDISPFIRGYLLPTIYNYYYDTVDINIIITYSKLFGVNFKHILETALKNLLVVKSKDVYTIKINKTIKLYNHNLEYWINLITYGNREIKGYPILIRLFKHFADNIGIYWKRWKDGY